MDKGTYSESVYCGYTVPRELVLHFEATGHKECKGFCFTSWFKLYYENKVLFKYTSWF